jgi:hypothetical protein
MIDTVVCLSTARLRATAGDPAGAVICVDAPAGPPNFVPHGYSAALRLDFDAPDRTGSAHAGAGRPFTPELGRAVLHFLVTVHRMPRVRTLVCACNDGVRLCGPVAAYAADLFGAELLAPCPEQLRRTGTYALLYRMAHGRDYRDKLAYAPALRMR